MENTETIGNVLKRERESRGLSIKEVADATKITAQNLSALEENRFDAFPNRVYTRAFLRDYANYLGLDSDSLLTQYESELGNKQDAIVATPVRRGSGWKFAGRFVLGMLIVGGLAAGGYYYYDKSSTDAADIKIIEHAAPPSGPVAPVATLPKVPTVPNVVKPPVGPVAAPTTPGAPTTPAVPAAPVATDKLTLQVATLQPVWVRIEADGKKVYEGILPKGSVKIFEAKKKIAIRAGKAGAVQLKLNGVTQPSLGTLGAPGEKEFSAPVVTTPPAVAPAATPAAPAAAKPAARMPR